VATNRKRILVPSVMGAGGRRLLDARDDVEVVAFPTTISAANFHTLLRSGGEVRGAILGLTVTAVAAQHRHPAPPEREDRLLAAWYRSFNKIDLVFNRDLLEIIDENFDPYLPGAINRRN